MGDISKEDYERLDLKDALQYRTISVLTCSTEGCRERGLLKQVNSEEPPFDFIYAKKLDAKEKEYTVYAPMKTVCTTCMVVRDVLDVEYFKRPEETKFNVNVTKAKGDRGKNYYRDFSKQSWKDDPEAGKNATQLSQKDINKLKSF